MNARNYRVNFSLSPLDFPAINGLGSNTLFLPNATEVKYLYALHIFQKCISAITISKSLQLLYCFLSQQIADFLSKYTVPGCNRIN